MSADKEQRVISFGTELTLNDYQKQAAVTALYPEAGYGSLPALLYVALGLGEVGEIQGKVKKILRDSDGRITAETRTQILHEAGDALWYLARLCSELGTDLSAVANANLHKLADRAERGVIRGSGDDR